MDFYLEPAFFILLVPILAIAAILGLTGHKLAPFGAGVSWIMLALMFGRTPVSFALFVGFVVLSMMLARWVWWLFASRGNANGKPLPRDHAVGLYRLALAAQIAPLAIYKVGVMADPDFWGFLGISYITFKAVQQLIETRDGLITEWHPLIYLYFLTFFPTFTSGPIMRSRAFAADAQAVPSRDIYLDKLYRGLGWLVLGAIYKFVGAPLASWLMWAGPAALGSARTVAFALSQMVYDLGYGIELFFDFAGYSAMAMGVGLVLGIEVPRNFHAPFLAVDIKDFWNRWHMSLSFWLRDFVFMRFTGTAVARHWFASPLPAACLGFVINMTLMGAWHGLTLAYLIYGLYHGCLLAACEVLQRKWGFYKRHRRKRWFKICSWAITMVAVFFGFALFSGQVFDPSMVTG